MRSIWAEGLAKERERKMAEIERNSEFISMLDRRRSPRSAKRLPVDLCGSKLMSCMFDHAVVKCNDVIRSVSLTFDTEIETRVCARSVDRYRVQIAQFGLERSISVIMIMTSIGCI